MKKSCRSIRTISGPSFLIKPTKQRFAQLISETLDELKLNGHTVGIAGVHENPWVLCATVSVPDGDKRVFIDFRASTDEDSARREIRNQLA
jgi:hypothetical protein